MKETINIIDAQQYIQEERYFLPYHYIDIESDEANLLTLVVYKSRIRRVIEIITEYIPHSKNLLDIGCGDGRFCYEAKEIEYRVGIDFSNRAIEWARMLNPDCLFHTEPISSLLHFREFFDTVVCIDTLEHIPFEEVHEFLAQMGQCIKPGGFAIFTIPSDYYPVEPKHYQHFSVETLSKALAPHFKIKYIEGFGPQRGLHSRTLKWIRRISHYSFPFRSKSVFLKSMSSLYKDNAYKYLVHSDPEISSGLIAVCEKT